MSENAENTTEFNQFAAEWFDPEQVLKAVTREKQTQLDPQNNLEKIEAALREHPGVQDVHVIVRGDKELIAYIVRAGSESISSKLALETFLKEKLPLRWLPNAFVFLDNFPRSANGEIDLAKLPAPEMDIPVAQPYIAPRTPTEEELAQIWAALLGHEHISIHDDFFELGGHSLLATQLLSRVCDTFSVDIPMRVFFTNPNGRITIADLARIVEEYRLEQYSDEDVTSAMEMLNNLSEEEIARLLAENDPEND